MRLFDARLFERIRRMQSRFDSLAERMEQGFANTPEEDGMAETESKASSRDTAPEVAEQPRTRKSVERPPQDSNKGSTAGAIPRAPTAEPDPVQESRELP